jgi:hypothetical protein
MKLGSGLVVTYDLELYFSMAQPLPLEFPRPVYHVTSRGNARQKIVRNDIDRKEGG